MKPLSYRAAADESVSARVAESLPGVVGYCVNGPRRVGEEYAPARLVHELREGLPIRELEGLQQTLGLPMDRLAPLLGLSKATLHRRKVAGRLDQAESDRVVRYARLLGRAIEVMESIPAARQWLASPQVGLGGEIPLEFAQTEVGAREVEDLLGRIEYGVYA